MPLIFNAPSRFAARRVARPVSLVDLLPSLVELAGAAPDWADPLDGISLVPLLEGDDSTAQRSVIAEYTDMGVTAPCRMIRRGSLKLMYTHGQPWRLYDLANDADELEDVAEKPAYREAVTRLQHELLENWNPELVLQKVLTSQRRRLFIRKVSQASGKLPDWSYQATRDDRRRYVRSSGAAGAKARARFPFVPSVDDRS